jgi:hypothetical protein
LSIINNSFCNNYSIGAYESAFICRCTKYIFKPGYSFISIVKEFLRSFIIQTNKQTKCLGIQFSFGTFFCFIEFVIVIQDFPDTVYFLLSNCCTNFRSIVFRPSAAVSISFEKIRSFVMEGTIFLPVS